MMNNVIELNDYRPHASLKVRCTYCTFTYIAVFPQGAKFPFYCRECDKKAVMPVKNQ